MAKETETNLSRVHSVGMLSNLNDLRKHKNLCDISLRVGGCSLLAHKVVLSASSPYFKAMFTQEMAEKNQPVVDLKSIDVEAMRTLIDFAYTGNLEVSSSNVQSLLPAATHFQMNLVIDECCRFLESHLHIYNCIGIWRFADTYGLFQLTKKLMKFINQNFEEISKLDEILDLPIKYLIRILKSDDLNVASEESVFRLVEAWILSNFSSRKAHIHKLIQLVRMPLLDASFLDAKSRLNKLLCNKYFVQDVYKSTQATNFKESCTQRCSPKILCAVGGKSGLFATLGSMEIYTPENDIWQTVSPLPHHRYECGAVVCDRKLYLIGGIQCKPYKYALFRDCFWRVFHYRRICRQHTNSVTVWDPENYSWNPAPSMMKCRSSFGVVVVKGDIYVLGGYDGGSYLKAMERLSQQKQQWEQMPDMLQTRTCFSAASLHDSVYAIGGYGPVHQSSVESYNIATQMWSYVTPMLTKRINFGVAVFKDFIYVVGGHSGTAHLRSVERFNSRDNDWEICSPMTRPRTGVGTAVIAGRLYAVGGHSGHEYLSDVDCYDLASTTWQKCSGMDLPRCGFGLAAM